MQAQQQAGEIKKRLDAITVTGTAEGGKITVTASANKVIQSVVIDDELLFAWRQGAVGRTPGYRHK